MNFKIKSSALISSAFSNRGISDFQQACDFIKNLAYRRNGNRKDSLCVFTDLGGTCSTKHAVLKRLADENGCADIKLMLGIFKMNQVNTPKVASVLDKFGIQLMPEAHNYLKIDDKILDCTRRNSSAADFENDLLLEIEITPEQIADFKVDFQRKFLDRYLEENDEIKYDTEEFWKIREVCIAALQK